VSRASGDTQEQVVRSIIVFRVLVANPKNGSAGNGSAWSLFWFQRLYLRAAKSFFVRIIFQFEHPALREPRQRRYAAAGRSKHHRLSCLRSQSQNGSA
jgi:hypothetical protein